MKGPREPRPVTRSITSAAPRCISPENLIFSSPLCANFHTANWRDYRMLTGKSLRKLCGETPDLVLLLRQFRMQFPQLEDQVTTRFFA